MEHSRRTTHVCLLTLALSVVRVSCQGFPALGSLDWLPLNLGEKKVAPPSISDYASQGFGLLNYFTNLKPKSLDALGKDTNFLGIPGVKGVPDVPGLPNIPLLQGVPAVPGLSGSFPGVGACLPQGTPLVNSASPSIFQDLLRSIPGAHDLLKSLNRPPKIDPQRLMGKWYWVISTPSAHNRYCGTSEYSGLINSNSSSATFSVVDSYRENAPHGFPKFSFGYGLVFDGEASVYTQSDPCPYQVFAVSPQEGEEQYEYVLFSNWAKYPVFVLAKDLNNFLTTQKSEVDEVLRKNGFTNFITDVTASVSVSDWSFCKKAPVNVGNIAADIVHGILFGGRKR